MLELIVLVTVVCTVTAAVWVPNPRSRRLPDTFDLLPETGDLPCPWCETSTSEADLSCPGCHRSFGAVTG